MAVTVGVGLTVIVNVSGVPKHVPIDGVTTIVAVSEIPKGVVKVKLEIFPEPFAANPILVLSFVQL